jgi:hypothetical protein
MLDVAIRIKIEELVGRAATLDGFAQNEGWITEAVNVIELAIQLTEASSFLVSLRPARFARVGSSDGPINDRGALALNISLSGWV